MLHPLFEQRNLGSRERLAFAGRRHDLGRLGRADPGDKLALFRLAGHDGDIAAFEFAERSLPDIEAQAGLALLLIWTMAGETVFGEQGQNLAVEVDRRRRRRGDRGSFGIIGNKEEGSAGAHEDPGQARQVE